MRAKLMVKLCAKVFPLFIFMRKSSSKKKKIQSMRMNGTDFIYAAILTAANE